MMVKVIKSAKEYAQVLKAAEKLVALDPETGTPEGDRLELLVLLISEYETQRFPLDMPTPLEAIEFRMEQAGLTRKDLVPILGSRSKVSEVLRGKRSMTLKMIRALHTRLGIPAEVLLQEPEATIPDEDAGIDWARFPMREMLKRGWLGDFAGSTREAKEGAEELLRAFFSRSQGCGLDFALFRSHVRRGSEMNLYALAAWCSRAVELASGRKLEGAYRKGTVTEEFIRDLVSLSYLRNGPLLAKEFLDRNGIHLVLLRHLPATHLDGAALFLADGSPVVALTLRHDRLDNFWFCLCHELAHIALHLGEDGDEWFFDDLEARGDSVEEEADELAARALIPPAKWRNAGVRTEHNPIAVRRFAEKLRISPAIVAGRIQFEKGNYKILSRMVGHGEVRECFLGADSGVA